MLALLLIFLTTFLFATNLLTTTQTGLSSDTPTPIMTPSPSRFCLTEEEINNLKSQPTAFVCDGHEWVLAALDAPVKKNLHCSRKTIDF